MSRVFNGTSDKGVISSALLSSLASTNAFHISAWAKTDSDTALQFVFGVGSSSSSTPLIVMGLDGTATGDKMYGLIRDNTPSAGAAVLNPTNGFTANTWHRLDLRNLGVAERYAFLDANQGGVASNLSSQSASFTVDTTSVGVLKRTTESGFFDGRIARITIWRSSSSANLPGVEDRWLLSHGADPSDLKSASIVYHWDDDLAAVTGGQSWTWTGTSTDSDNPTTSTEQVTATSDASWEVPAGGSGSAGFTNTGLGYDSDNDEVLVGDFTNTRIVRCEQNGTYIGEIVLGGSPPSSSVQGVAWDSSDGTYWVCHYAATNGTIRHYNSSGTLLDTFSPGVSNAGPSGCAYDAVNDRILAVWENGTVRGYDCSDGSLDETISLEVLSGQTADGLAIDPSDSGVLWATMDTTTASDFVGRYTRSSGALQWIMYGQQDIESLVFINGTLWGCADAEFHSSVANGNRVHQFDVSVATTPTLTDPGWLVSGNQITPRGTYAF